MTDLGVGASDCELIGISVYCFSEMEISNIRIRNAISCGAETICGKGR